MPNTRNKAHYTQLVLMERLYQEYYDVYHYEPALNSAIDFSQLHVLTQSRSSAQRERSIPTIAESIRIPIRRYQAMRNSSKPRLSTAERLYLAKLVRLELTSLN